MNIFFQNEKINIFNEKHYMNGLNTKSIKKLNINLILSYLRKQGSMSRSELTELTGLSPTTITNIINDLLSQSLVVEGESEDREQMGRPRTKLRLVPDSRFAVGIHIGVGKYGIAITDLLGDIVARHETSFDITSPADDILNAITESTHSLLQDFDMSRVLGIGVGALGLVSPQQGLNRFAPNLGWHDVDIRTPLADKLDLPVAIDNNVRLMALAEAMFGKGKEAESLAYIQVEQGVGAGFFLEGNLYRGNLNTAGEIGHHRFILNDAKRCSCGNLGCLETLVAEPYLVAQARIHRDVSSFSEITTLAAQGDETMFQILEQSARYLGIAVANLINTFSPELILLGGVYTNHSDLLLPVIKEEVQNGIFANIINDVQITVASHNAGLIGAAAFALDQYLYHQTETIGELE